jgi:hypothetical protein
MVFHFICKMKQSQKHLDSSVMKSNNINFKKTFLINVEPKKLIPELSLDKDKHHPLEYSPSSVKNKVKIKLQPKKFTFEIPRNYNFHNSYKNLSQDNVNNIPNKFNSRNPNSYYAKQNHIKIKLPTNDERKINLSNNHNKEDHKQNDYWLHNYSRSSKQIDDMEKNKKLYIRRSITTFDNESWDKFNRAWDNINKNGTLIKFVKIHDLICKKKSENKSDNFVLGTPLFLPWYRWFIALMEDELQKEGAELPFWNPLELSEIPTQLINVKPTINNHSTVSPHQQKVFLKDTNNIYVLRNFNKKIMPKATDLFKVMSHKSFESSDGDFIFSCMSKQNQKGFAFELEKFYNSICNAIGGNLLLSNISPADPLFWILHSYIDLIWVLWTINGNNINIYLENYNHEFNLLMTKSFEIMKNYELFKSDLTPLQIQNLGNINQIKTVNGIGYKYSIEENKYVINL